MVLQSQVDRPDCRIKPDKKPDAGLAARFAVSRVSLSRPNTLRPFRQPVDCIGADLPATDKKQTRPKKKSRYLFGWLARSQTPINSAPFCFALASRSFNSRSSHLFLLFLWKHLVSILVDFDDGLPCSRPRLPLARLEEAVDVRRISPPRY